MFNVVTETPAFLPDMSRSFIQNYDTSYIWTTPYATLEEAEAAAEHIRSNGCHKAVTKIEEVSG